MVKLVSLRCLVCQWFDAIEGYKPKMAHLLCRIILEHCHFEWDIKLFDRALFHIPPLCKLNPFSEQLVGLRFKALSYLAEECREDVLLYC